MPPIQIYYVLFLDEQLPDIKTRFANACNGKIEMLATIDEGNKKPGVVLECQTTGERPVPDAQVLAYFGRGFDATSAAALNAAKAAISLTGVGPFDSQHRLLRLLTLCVSRLAKELNAVVFDGADWLTFTPKAFQELRCAEIENGQLSAAQFGVRAYRVDGGIRSVSMGLEKFGQANFCLPLFSEHHMPMMDRMMTLAMQQMIESKKRLEPGPLELSIPSIENPRLKRELAPYQQAGASGRITLQLQTVTPEEGDPKVLLGPIFKAHHGPQLEAEQASLLKRLFGADRHVSTNVDMGEIIQQAIQKARQDAIKILSTPTEWQQKGRRFRVAVGLPDIKEVVWLEVTSWQNGQGEGILLSQPQTAPKLNSGDTVSFTADAVMDYTLTNPEGILAKGGVDEMVRKMRGG